MLKIFHCRGWTPLHIASSRGDVRTSFVLVNQGGGAALLEERTRLGETPLLLAARKGRLSAAKYLLDAGADPDGGARADFAEATPLHEVNYRKKMCSPSFKWNKKI